LIESRYSFAGGDPPSWFLISLFTARAMLALQALY